MIQRCLLVLALVLTTSIVAAQGSTIPSRPALDLDVVRVLPVLDGQRFKPFDSLARETVLAITGKERFQRSDPVFVYLHWFFEPDLARGLDCIKLPDAATAQDLGFSASEIRSGVVSYEVLADHDGFLTAVRAAISKSDSDRSLRDREALRLHGRWSLFAMVAGISKSHGSHAPAAGSASVGRGLLPFLAPEGELQEGVPYRWSSPSDVADDGRHAAALSALDRLGRSFVEEDAEAFAAAGRDLIAYSKESGYPSAFPGAAQMARETRYNTLNPFFIAAMLEGLAAFLALLSLLAPRLRWAAIVPLIAGLGIHVWGLVERSLLSDRAMIGNLFESLIFVGACAALFGLFFTLRYRSPWFLFGGALLSAIALTAALSFPDSMSPKITALRPVLVNNFWIHVHVPTIMASYAALGLAWVLAHVWLGHYLVHAHDTMASREVARFTYAVMPIGLILLLAGMVLGGVWADASWGRFWGWDPKETWSFITWIVFLVIVHGRWSGWLKDFGVAMGTMVGGWALLWTYYGVNFFQSGLHSYAGTGGPSRPPLWLWIFSAFEVSLCAAALWRHSKSTCAPTERGTAALKGAST
ncbi:MAG: cytochrome c biogenesis protein CcsA [Planctomycetes bacterium]|nr:cytochrome c biogenesis protein CcsA [Planctomycetota bacterium]